MAEVRWGIGALGIWNGFQHAGHLLGSDGVLNNHVSALKHHLHCIDHFVEGRCGTALLSEPDQAEVCLAAVL